MTGNCARLSGGIEEQGTSADPANIRIGCFCERPALSLADAFKPGFLGTCKGNRPWLDSSEPGCTEQLHFLSRSATNTYFPQAVTVISLPIHEDELSTAIRKNWTSLQNATDSQFVGVLKSVPEIGASLSRFSNDDIYARIVQMRDDLAREAAQDPKIAEFDLLGSGTRVIGIDARNEPLFAETLVVPDMTVSEIRDGGPLIDSVVAVHRLQAVTCLYGFTRLEPAPTFAEQMLEDVRIAVSGAPLAEATDWLPAMNNSVKASLSKSDRRRFGLGHNDQRSRRAVLSWRQVSGIIQSDTSRHRSSQVCHTFCSTHFRTL